MAAEHVISYRLEESEVQAIRALQLAGEKSISITAKRLMRSALKSFAEKSPEELTEEKSIFVDKIDKIVDKIVDSDKLKEKLEEMLSSLVSSINQKFIEQEERLEAMEKS